MFFYRINNLIELQIYEVRFTINDFSLFTFSSSLFTFNYSLFIFNYSLFIFPLPHPQPFSKIKNQHGKVFEMENGDLFP